MSAIVQSKKLTPEEYLALEEKAETKNEYFNGEMFAMAGASIEHNRVKENLIFELRLRLEGTSCQSFSSDQRLKADPGGFYTYPDILLVCGKIERDPLNRNTITNPIVVFEVLSPSTEGYDRGAKFRRYQKIPSLREIVFVSQDEWAVQVCIRHPDGDWFIRTFSDPAGSFKLTSLPVEIPLTSVYQGLAELGDEPNSPLA